MSSDQIKNKFEIVNDKLAGVNLDEPEKAQVTEVVDNICVGDVVYLKSGGPYMTITLLREEPTSNQVVCKCTYFTIEAASKVPVGGECVVAVEALVKVNDFVGNPLE